MLIRMSSVSNVSGPQYITGCLSLWGVQRGELGDFFGLATFGTLKRGVNQAKQS
jgi:hypothetical protein